MKYPFTMDGILYPYQKLAISFNLHSTLGATSSYPLSLMRKLRLRVIERLVLGHTGMKGPRIRTHFYLTLQPKLLLSTPPNFLCPSFRALPHALVSCKSVGNLS